MLLGFQNIQNDASQFQQLGPFIIALQSHIFYTAALYEATEVLQKFSIYRDFKTGQRDLLQIVLKTLLSSLHSKKKKEEGICKF